MKFPERISEREDWIFDRIIAGDFDARWTEVRHTDGPDEVRLLVMEDALRVDGVRVNVSARLEQRLADAFDASLMTALVADVVFASAVRRVLPAPMPISTSVESMVKHSAAVDARLAAVGGTGLASTVGKHWILDAKMLSAPGRACNYGWHFVGSSCQGIAGFPAATPVNKVGSNPVRVIQPNATAHDPRHSDYSQVCQLVSQTCWVNGQEKRFSEVLTDPSLARLVSHQGPLSFTRQPGVDEVRGQVVLMPTCLDA